MSVMSVEVPPDWYRTAFDNDVDIAWMTRSEDEVDRALGMLRPRGGERVLDLACGAGRHALELARRGFDVVAADISSPLLEIAAGQSQIDGLELEFVEGDLRELDFEAEFDIVLSLNDGAIGYFESEEENQRTFEVIARALKPGGRHLAQVPNLIYAEEHMPERFWTEGEVALELVERDWNEDERCLEGVLTAIRYWDSFRPDSALVFRQRLYEVEELRAALARVGMTVEETFHPDGSSGAPSEDDYDLFALSARVE